MFFLAVASIDGLLEKRYPVVNDLFFRVFFYGLKIKGLIAFLNPKGEEASLICGLHSLSIEVEELVDGSFCSADLQLEVVKFHVITPSLHEDISYGSETGEEAFFFEVEPSLFIVDLIGVIWLDKAWHYPEGIFIDLLLFLNFFDLDSRSTSGMVVLKVVKIGGSDRALKHRLEDFLFLLFVWIGLHSSVFIITN